MNQFPHIDPIPTFYRGITYRSRTEARWAVFFHTLNIEYHYELEGTPLGSSNLWYLPDFWLPELGIWIEIKPKDPLPIEIRKARLLSDSCGLPVFIPVQPIGYIPPWPLENEDTSRYDYGDGPPRHLAFLGEGIEDDNYLWTRCPSCHRIGLTYQGRCHRLCRCESGAGKEGRSETRCDSLLVAYSNAIMERFDRCETIQRPRRHSGQEKLDAKLEQPEETPRSYPSISSLAQTRIG